MIKLYLTALAVVATLITIIPAPQALAGSSCDAPASPGVNWAGCDFSNANLSRVDLTGANLQGANFQGATLSFIKAEDADFSGANLDSAVMLGADLEGANFNGANMNGAFLTKSLIAGATFDGTSLSNTYWNNGSKCSSQSVTVCSTEKYLVQASAGTIRCSEISAITCRRRCK